MKNTCKDCQRRVAGCHATCEQYAMFRAEIDSRKSKIVEARKKERSPRAKWPERLKRQFPHKVPSK